MEANFLYVPSGKIGYGRMGIKLAAALAKLGVEQYRLAGEALSEAQQFSIKIGPPKPCNVVCWAAIPGHAHGWLNGQYPTVLTMYETNRLPETFREILHEFEMVIVPSAQNLELFSQHHRNVRQINLGIDPYDWAYRERPPLNEFRFLTAGQGPRKGTDLAVKAFKKLWGQDRSWGSGPTPTLYIKARDAQVKDSDGHDLPLLPGRIHLVPGLLSDEDERDLYGMAHCYVQPSRGEGFGLMPLQAIAQGCPTILTDAHGHAAFSHLGYGIPTSMTLAAYFHHGPSGEWWEPDLDILCDQMRYVYDNYEDAVDVAKHSSDEALARFTWEDSANQWIETIGKDRLDTPYRGDGGWHEPDPRLFPVVTTRTFIANIAGVDYRLERGVEYWLRADVKRIIFEAQILDPNCIMEDSGLSSVQVAQSDKYTIDRMYCPTCSQRLNTQPTRADDIYEAMEHA